MEKLKKLFIENKYSFLAFMFFLVLISVIPLFFDAYKGVYCNLRKASDYGSFIGGFLGAVFTLISVLLLYKTLIAQINLTHLERFESRFFEMIRLHRQNLTELEINGDIRDKKVFIALMKEFRCIRDFVTKQFSEEDLGLLNQKKHNLFVISFLILFFGIGDNSNRMLKILLQNYLSNDTAKKLIQELEKYKINYRDFNEEIYEYTYFDGHQFRLGHYFRQLYQAISYLDSANLSDDQKKSYAKMLRAQLSNYEQALFFINSISPLGLNWWRKGYISNYGLVKNIPSDFFEENEIDLKSYFPKLGSCFINKKCDRNDVYFEFETYGSDDDYVFPNGCITKMGNNKKRIKY